MLRRRSRHAVLVASLALPATLIVLATQAGLSAWAQRQTAPARPAPSAAAAPAEVKPWPSATALAEAKRVAQNLPLFASDEPLPITLVADFGAVQRDREESNRMYPATIVVAGKDGREASIPVKIRTRGHSRRKPDACTFAPLRIEFDANPVGTVFEGQKKLKLGVHCRDAGEYPQYVVREYPVYRMFNLLTPRSFRARLAEAKYMDAKTKAPVRARMGLFLEDDDDVARRLEGRASDQLGLSFRRTEMATTTLAMLFEYFIGNTDFGLTGQHNFRIVQTPDLYHYVVPYDFDYSGVVNAPYAAPGPGVRVTTIRERLYLGPCHTPEELERYLSRFKAMREQLLGVYDSVPQLTPKYVEDAKRYLEGFFRTIDDPGRVKRAFINGCNGRRFPEDFRAP